MKILYLREEPKNGAKLGNIRGCIVILDKEHVGYSLCHPKDKNKSSKALARHIALARARKCEIRETINHTLYKCRDGRFQTFVRDGISQLISNIPELRLKGYYSEESICSE